MRCFWNQLYAHTVASKISNFLKIMEITAGRECKPKWCLWNKLTWVLFLLTGTCKRIQSRAWLDLSHSSEFYKKQPLEHHKRAKKSDSCFQKGSGVRLPLKSGCNQMSLINRFTLLLDKEVHRMNLSIGKSKRILKQGWPIEIFKNTGVKTIKIMIAGYQEI